MVEDQGTARYVFRVRFRLELQSGDVTVDPNEFETTLSRAADRPGADGWLFFRDNLWRGEINDEGHFRELTEEALDVPVLSVSFSELRTEEAYLDALKETVGEHLAEFNDDSVHQTLSKYLGSSIHVVEDVD